MSMLGALFSKVAGGIGGMSASSVGSLAVGAWKASNTAAIGRANARALEEQARVALDQGREDEYAQRREARLQLSKQAASLAQAGIGYGGTAANVMRESHINAELDALNYRYRGVSRARALLTEAKITRKESRLTAGAELLGAVGSAWQKRK